MLGARSRRVTGAYRFVVRPGTDTIMDVAARIFLREQVTKIGIAPLTTMYLFGENQPSTTGRTKINFCVRFTVTDMRSSIRTRVSIWDQPRVHREL